MIPCDFVARVPSFVAGFLTGFVPGLLSGYVLLRLGDRRKSLKERSSEIYVPMHHQLFNALEEVTRYQRPNSADPNSWKNIEASGIAKGIPRRLRNEIADVYVNAIPEFDLAWKNLNSSDGTYWGTTELLRSYDEKFGVELPFLPGEPWPQWWAFLLTTPFQPALLNLPHFDRVRLWNKYLVRSVLSGSGIEPVEVLHQIWTEAQSNAAFQRVRVTREVLLTKLPLLLKKLNRRIQV
jgi:hypothetical protein